MISGRVVVDLSDVPEPGQVGHGLMGRRVDSQRSRLWRATADAPAGSEVVVRVAAGQYPEIVPGQIDLGHLRVVVECADASTVKAWVARLRQAA